MIAYNVTIKVAHAIVTEWIEWQKKEHIPEIMATGLFNDHKFFHLLEQDDEEGPTFIVQYFASSKLEYDKYISDHAPLLRKKALERWANQFIAFRTVMEVVE